MSFCDKSMHGKLEILFTIHEFCIMFFKIYVLLKMVFLRFGIKISVRIVVSFCHFPLPFYNLKERV